MLNDISSFLLPDDFQRMKPFDQIKVKVMIRVIFLGLIVWTSIQVYRVSQHGMSILWVSFLIVPMFLLVGLIFVKLGGTPKITVVFLLPLIAIIYFTTTLSEGGILCPPFFVFGTLVFFMTFFGGFAPGILLAIVLSLGSQYYLTWDLQTISKPNYPIENLNTHLSIHLIVIFSFLFVTLWGVRLNDETFNTIQKKSIKLFAIVLPISIYGYMQSSLSMLTTQLTLVVFTLCLGKYWRWSSILWVLVIGFSFWDNRIEGVTTVMENWTLFVLFNSLCIPCFAWVVNWLVTPLNALSKEALDSDKTREAH